MNAQTLISRIAQLDVDVSGRVDGRALAWDGTNHIYVGAVLQDGSPGGQTIYGGTNSGDNLTLKSTSNLTKGKVLWGDPLAGGGAFDETTAFLGLGNQTPAAMIHMDTSISAANWGSNGLWMRINQNPGSSASNTSSLSGATVADLAMCSIGAVGLISSNPTVTYTNASTLYIAGPPTAGTGTAITNPWAIFVVSGNTKLAGRLAVGAGNPAATGILSMDSGNQSFTTTTGTAGCMIRQAGRTFTDTGDSTTQTAWHMNSFAAITLAASNAMQVNASATVYIAGPPIAGANMTLASTTSLRVETGDVALGGRVGAGTLFPAASLHVGGALTQAAWTVNGIGVRVAAATYTDNTTAAGTTASMAVHAIARPTVATSVNAVTFTDAATLLLANSPLAGTNVTITRPWALWVQAGNAKFSGNVGVGVGALDASAALQIDSTTQGLLLPRMSGTAGVTSPAEGLVVYDTAAHQAKVWNGSAWAALN